jgi:hypothetical protein
MATSTSLTCWESEGMCRPRSGGRCFWSVEASISWRATPRHAAWAWLMVLTASPGITARASSCWRRSSAPRSRSRPRASFQSDSSGSSHALCNVLVQDAADVPSGEAPASDRDAWLRRRIEFADRILLEYAKALAPIRSSGLTDHADFQRGM